MQVVQDMQGGLLFCSTSLSFLWSAWLNMALQQQDHVPDCEMGLKSTYLLRK